MPQSLPRGNMDLLDLLFFYTVGYGASTHTIHYSLISICVKHLQALLPSQQKKYTKAIFFTHYLATISSSVQPEGQPLIYPRLAIQLVVETQALWSDLQLFDLQQVLMSCYDTQHLDSHTFGVSLSLYMRDIIIQLNMSLRKTSTHN